MNSSREFKASTTAHILSLTDFSETPYFAMMSYGEPPAKYRKAQANQMQVETGPLRKGAAYIYLPFLPSTRSAYYCQKP